MKTYRETLISIINTYCDCRSCYDNTCKLSGYCEQNFTDYTIEQLENLIRLIKDETMAVADVIKHKGLGDTFDV